MKFICAKKKDLSEIMHIIGQAQAYLASQHIEQWQNGYPNESGNFKRHQEYRKLCCEIRRF